MRILMLAQFYRPIIGGEETHVRSLSSALAQRGHEVSVATLWHAGLPETEEEQGVHIHRIRSTMQRAGGMYSTERQHAPPFPDPEIMLALRRLIKQERPDVVHAHNWILHSFTPMKAWSGAKFVVSLHDYSMICAQKLLLYHGEMCSGPGLTKCLGCASRHYGTTKGIPTALANWVFTMPERTAVDMFIPVSEAVAELNGLTHSRLPYRVIPNFVADDAGTLKELPNTTDPRLDQLPREPFLLFVGDLRHLKGVDVLVRAYASVQANVADVPPLVLIGRECEDTPAELPPNVMMIKGWPHELVMQAWRRALIGLAPSVGPEAFGIVVIEAMASGRPVIASRIGGIPEIVVDGETGILFPAGDSAALASALRRLLADRGLIERMGQAGQQRIVRFQASTVVPQIEQVYQELTASTKARQAFATTSAIPE